MLTPSERGKRRLAQQLLLFQAALTIIGIWVPVGWTMAQFYAPFLIPAAITLFIGDAVSDAYIKSSSSRNASR